MMGNINVKKIESYNYLIALIKQLPRLYNNKDVIKALFVTKYIAMKIEEKSVINNVDFVNYLLDKAKDYKSQVPESIKEQYDKLLSKIKLHYNNKCKSLPKDSTDINIYKYLTMIDRIKCGDILKHYL